MTQVRVPVEITDVQVGGLIDAVGELLRRAAPVPPPGDLAETTVNGNDLAYLWRMWKSLPPSVQEAYKR